MNKVALMVNINEALSHQVMAQKFGAFGPEEKLAFCDEAERRVDYFRNHTNFSPAAFYDIWESLLRLKAFNLEEICPVAGYTIRSASCWREQDMAPSTSDGRRTVLREAIAFARKNLHAELARKAGSHSTH